MQPMPDHSSLVKLSRYVFRFDESFPDWGWRHDIYIDQNSPHGGCFIADFPCEGAFFEMSQIPTLGTATIATSEGIYHVKIYER